MLINCADCNSRVDALSIGEHEEFDDDVYEASKVILLKCPVCKRALLGQTTHLQIGEDEWVWSNLLRLWPEAETSLHHTIPDGVSTSLEEAKICYRAKAFSACAVMCGRAIEAICVEKTQEKTLHKGLQALRDTGVIDGRLFDWGESLRQERNIGAHATGEKIRREDAKDILDFAIAICDYVYVLSDRYEKYKSRKEKRKSHI